MAAQSFQIYAVEYPAFNINPGAGTVNDGQAVDSSISFSLPITIPDTFASLSINNAPTGSDIEGLLFVPTLNESDPCNATIQKYIPSNVTKLDNVAPNQLAQIAIVPWVSGDCARSVLNSLSAWDISGNSNNQPIALITYLAAAINAGNFSAANPPSSSDGAWSIDGSTSWAGQYQFPVYAINSDYGDQIVKELAQYSGNMTKAPYGPQLAATYGAENNVRLYCNVYNGYSDTLPSLWVFLLIVLGLMLGMIGCTSLFMHFVQRRRREELRQAVETNRLDLESLGIKRLKVPQQILDKQPLLVYVGDKSAEQVPLPASPDPEISTKQDAIAAGPKDTSANDSKTNDGRPTPASSIEISKNTPLAKVTNSEDQSNLPPISSLPLAKLDFSQPACSICLDDFESSQSIVRQLPCKHIFHPACIDSVLKEYSSLCPVCKHRVLPAGYCPEINNDMVRRVRGIRHLRRIEAYQRGQNDFLDPIAGPDGPRRVAVVHGRAGHLQRHIVIRSGMYPPGSRAEHVPQETELTTVASPTSENAARPANVPREEWARRRARGIYQQPYPVDEVEAQRQVRRPAWRRAVGTVFPMVQ